MLTIDAGLLLATNPSETTNLREIEDFVAKAREFGFGDDAVVVGHLALTAHGDPTAAKSATNQPAALVPLVQDEPTVADVDRMVQAVTP